MKEGKENAVVNDETLLLVSGKQGRSKGEEKDYVKKLANAVLQVYEKHGSAKLRCCGAAAINNAIKSIIIARKDIEKNNDYVRSDFDFTNVEFQGESKTGILFEVTQDLCAEEIENIEEK